MPAPSDALLTKTDAELQFFVDNPQFYQPALVAAARQELARRAAEGPRPVAASPTLAAAPAALVEAVAPAAPVQATPAPFAPPPPLGPPPSPDIVADYLVEPARRRPLLVPLLGLLAAVALGLSIYWWRSAAQGKAALAARTAAKLSPDSLKLETAATAPLPTFDVEQDVARQLAVVPAAELKQVSSQEMRQYREVSKRFWQAQHPTEHLIGLALANQAPSYTLLIDQIRFTEGQWHQAGNALVYGFHFPPTMADQVARMRAIASVERRVLEHLKTQSLSQKDLSEYTVTQELAAGLRQKPRALEMHL
ncbi:MAG: hypothetical protein ACRYFK_10745 [Janthinobacterium lividum]